MILCLYLIQRDKSEIQLCGEARSYVIAAEDEASARDIAAETASCQEQTDYAEIVRGVWHNKAQCKLIGNAAEAVQPGVVLKDCVDCCSSDY